ncbi:Matrix metalloproteinase-15 [Homalodisca vitripennis]|nr:Matrix metalloproteinase-15 [Homalodisca vitripennis]
MSLKSAIVAPSSQRLARKRNPPHRQHLFVERVVLGVDFFAVAVHEIGHSLGLSHSPEDGSVMNPYYKHYDSSSFSLGYDDILAVYDLYVSKPLQDENDSWDDNDRSAETTTTTTTTTSTTTTTRPVRTTTWLPHVTYVGDDETVDDHKRHDPTHGVPDPEYPPTPTPATPDGCEGHFSAVSYLRGELFIFKNNYMWRLTAPGRVETGYPVSIHRMFHKLPQSLQRIDAAYERDTDSNIVFFSVWLYHLTTPPGPGLATMAGKHQDFVEIYSELKGTAFEVLC